MEKFRAENEWTYEEGKCKIIIEIEGYGITKDEVETQFKGIMESLGYSYGDDE